MNQPNDMPVAPRTATSAQATGHDPDVNARVRYALAEQPNANRREIAEALELDEWVVWQSLRRLQRSPYLRNPSP